MSKYEQRFGVKRRGRGRPVGSDVVFQMRDKDPELARQARQRAIALIIDDNKLQMRRLFEDEYRYLANVGGRTRRGRRRAGTG